MTRTILLSLCLVLYGVAALAQTTVRYTVVHPDGRRIPLNVYRLNDRDYASMEALGQAMFRGATLAPGGNEIRWKNTTLRSAPASFYLMYGSREGTRIAQMPYPAIAIQARTCLPLLPLCSALETLGLYAVDVQGNVIILKNPRGSAPTAMLFPSRPPEPEIAVRPRAAQPRIIEEEHGHDHSHDHSHEEEPDVDVITGLHTPAVSAASALDDVGAALEPFKAAAAGVGGHTPSASGTVPSVPVPQTPAVSVPKGAPAHTPPDAEVPSNRYVLPPGLYRREVTEPDSAVVDSLRSLLNDVEPQAGPPMASLILLPLATSLPAEPERKPEIIALELEIGNGSVELTLTGNTAIENYQRPEYNGRQLVLRLPGARNAVPAATLRRLGTTAPLTAVRAEHIGDILVYRLTFTGDIDKCSYTRRSSSSLKFTVVTPTGGAVSRPSSEAKKWALDVIVLDAGHGGKDVGAISVGGTHEKDVTLALVKKLGALIERNMPDTKVVYTREDDRFIELYRRGQIANEAGGKLFISIHCNSMPSKPHPANGFETYILRPGRNDDAVRVAERENSAIKFEKNQKRYKQLNDEQFIVVNMAQSAFVKFSEMFAAVVQEEVAKATPLSSRGVNQAGFYVLVGASMPNILFESAFLSNTDDEKYITSDRGQDAIARGLFNAIRVYADQYEQLIRAQK